jgi:hypothetical protein
LAKYATDKRWVVCVAEETNEFGAERAAIEHARRLALKNDGRSAIIINRANFPVYENRDLGLLMLGAGTCMLAWSVWRMIVPFALLVQGALILRNGPWSRVFADIRSTPLQFKRRNQVVTFGNTLSISLLWLSPRARQELVDVIQEYRERYSNSSAIPGTGHSGDVNRTNSPQDQPPDNDPAPNTPTPPPDGGH